MRKQNTRSHIYASLKRSPHHPICMTSCQQCFATCNASRKDWLAGTSEVLQGNNTTSLAFIKGPSKTPDHRAFLTGPTLPRCGLHVVTRQAPHHWQLIQISTSSSHPVGITSRLQKLTTCNASRTGRLVGAFMVLRGGNNTTSSPNH